MNESTRAVYEADTGEWAALRPPRLGKVAVAFSHRCLPGRPIVDLGCGPGNYFPTLGRPLVGLDGARAMLRQAAAVAPEVGLVQADLAGLPFAPRRLGGAWARASYLHLRRHDLPGALAQLHRAMAVGAPLEMTLRIGTTEGELPDDDFPGRFFALWEADDLEAVVVGAGFSVSSIDTNDDWFTVRAVAERTLPDFVGPGMRLLLSGLNPSVFSADAGYNYAGPTNRFWRALVGAGLVTPDNARRPFAMLRGEHIGMTDMVKRATPGASSLSAAEYRAGAERLRRLVAWLRPGVVVFVGLAGYRAAIFRRAVAGAQAAPFGGATAYVMPSTSGLNAATSLSTLVEHLRRAAQLAAP